MQYDEFFANNKISETKISGLIDVTQLMMLFADFQLQKPDFVPRSVNIGFLVDKTALEQVFLRFRRFSPNTINPPLLHIHSCIKWGMDKGTSGDPVPRRQSHPVAGVKIFNTVGFKTTVLRLLDGTSYEQRLSKYISTFTLVPCAWIPRR
jgi:hypothetical protein